GLFVWTGWVEFSFVYYAKRFEVKGLIENGEMVTKPEYLIMPSSIGFLGVLFLIYVLGNNSNCPFFIWFQKRLRIFSKIKEIPTEKNPAVVTFAEFIAILWTFYLLLLFAYDKNFFGDRHPVTYIIAFGSLFWSLYLFMRLMTFNQFAYSLRYSIPTVIIFWNFVEILGRWNLMKEIWLEPKQYSLEMGLLLLIFTLVTSYSIFLGFKPKKNLQ
ncbi:MAG: hypothetical protein HUU45_12565, partial [Leptospiraceae bacterium]|nr:hypothetical protein [Leptospiraceae bacterium]